jgi:hypothetical protein
VAVHVHLHVVSGHLRKGEGAEALDLEHAARYASALTVAAPDLAPRLLGDRVQGALHGARDVARGAAEDLHMAMEGPVMMLKGPRGIREGGGRGLLALGRPPEAVSETSSAYLSPVIPIQ